jgi:hypothetical protein
MTIRKQHPSACLSPRIWPLLDAAASDLEMTTPVPIEEQMGSSWDLGIFSSLAERRYARRASKELLELFRLVQSEQPELSGRELYHAVITRRLGANQKRAGEIVRRAEISFTEWPAEKELRFRHVVHYQVFDEFTHSGPGRENTRTNMGRVVARIIPERL